MLKIAERAALAGMSPAMAMKVARIASPLGIASLAGEGLYQVGKLDMKINRDLMHCLLKNKQLKELNRKHLHLILWKEA